MRNATTEFREKYFTKHIGTHKDLTREMITVIFVIFKCNIQLFDQDHVTDLMKDVHGISGGVKTLIPHQEI